MKNILLFITLIILLSSCQRKQDYIKQGVHYYPQLVFKSVGDFWTLQYSNDSAALEIKKDVEKTPILWNSIFDKLDYRYSLKNDRNTLQSIIVNDTIITHSDWGIYAKNEETEDTLINLKIDLVFGQIVFEENEIWIITEIHCSSINRENFNLEFKEAGIRYSLNDYTKKRNSIWEHLKITLCISRDGEYIEGMLSNMLINNTNSKEIYYYSAYDFLLNDYQYKENKKLVNGILQNKKSLKIRGTNIFNNNKKEFNGWESGLEHPKILEIKTDEIYSPHE